MDFSDTKNWDTFSVVPSEISDNVKMYYSICHVRCIIFEKY